MIRADSMLMLMMLTKLRFKSCRPAATLVLVALLGPVAAFGGSAQAASPAKSPTATASAPTNVVEEIPQSVFVMPSPTEPMKDPFFPDSTRLKAVETTVTSTNRVTVIAADLALKGLSGTPDAPLASINNITFGLGEEREVRTPTGRVRVRCVSINLNDETVVIEAGGQRRELRFPRRK